MIRIEPEGEWGDVRRFRFLRKMVVDGDKYLFPSRCNDSLNDQAGDLLSFSFLGGCWERRAELENLRYLVSLHHHGLTVEQLMTKAGATEEKLTHMGILPPGETTP